MRAPIACLCAALVAASCEGSDPAPGTLGPRWTLGAGTSIGFASAALWNGPAITMYFDGRDVRSVSAHGSSVGVGTPDGWRAIGACPIDVERDGSDDMVLVLQSLDTSGGEAVVLFQAATRQFVPLLSIPGHASFLAVRAQACESVLGGEGILIASQVDSSSVSPSGGAALGGFLLLLSRSWIAQWSDAGGCADVSCLPYLRTNAGIALPGIEDHAVVRTASGRLQILSTGPQPGGRQLGIRIEVCGDDLRCENEAGFIPAPVSPGISYSYAQDGSHVVFLGVDGSYVVVEGGEPARVLSHGNVEVPPYLWPLHTGGWRDGVLTAPCAAWTDGGGPGRKTLAFRADGAGMSDEAGLAGLAPDVSVALALSAPGRALFLAPRDGEIVAFDLTAGGG